MCGWTCLKWKQNDDQYFLSKTLMSYIFGCRPGGSFSACRCLNRIQEGRIIIISVSDEILEEPLNRILLEDEQTVQMKSEERVLSKITAEMIKDFNLIDGNLKRLSIVRSPLKCKKHLKECCKSNGSASMKNSYVSIGVVDAKILSKLLPSVGLIRWNGK